MVLLNNKLQPPAARTEWVRRDRLIASLIENADKRLILVDAPIGYGKTTLLAQWEASSTEERPFAWVTLDAADNDAKRLWTHVVEALRRIEPGLREGTIRMPAEQREAPSAIDVSRLVKELAVLPQRVIIVLDDYHQIHDKSCHESIDLLISKLPHTTQLVLATRSDPPLQLSRWRDRAEMMEFRVLQLRFDHEEAAQLLGKTLDHELEPHEIASLLNRTEGWPAGLYLAALSLRHEPDVRRFIEQFAGDNRHLVDYLILEVLNKLPESLRRFLLRTSILERFSAAVCDAVVGINGSQEIIYHLERSNLFLVSIDSRRHWYRYHRLFQGLLRSELQRSEPDVLSELHKRASEWHRKWGFLEEAIAHAIAANDIIAARDLIGSSWLPQWEAGRIEVVRSWLDELGDDGVASDAVLALVAAWTAGLSGRTGELERWLSSVEQGSFAGPLPDGTSTLESGSALVRSLFGSDGVGVALEAARRAVELEDESDTGWRGLALASLGYYLYVSGDRKGAIAALTEATGDSSHEANSHALALALLSMIAAEEGQRKEAQVKARDALIVVGGLHPRDNPGAVAAYVARGLVAEGSDDYVAAEAELDRAFDLVRLTPWLQPWITVQVLLTLAPVRSARGDQRGAGELLQEAKGIVKRHPDAGILADRVRRIEGPLDFAARTVPGQPLTERELAVLRLLPSSLTQREIGVELYLTINTVKSHIRSVFRKLDVTSRAQAVAKAGELGLIQLPPR
jgi:LuxR family maltose regulon positive regulatory protein